MDEETSSRIRDALLDAIGRQRPQPVSEAAKQQMLVSTLRLAGHTVSLVPPDSAGRDNAAQADVSTLPSDTTLPGDIMLPDDAAQPGDIAPSNETWPAGEPLVRNSMDWVNDPTRPPDYGKAQQEPFIVNDPTRAADYGKPQLMPDLVNDPSRPADYGKPQTLPFIAGNPTVPSAGGSPQPQPLRIHEPYLVSPGAQSGDPLQYLVPEPEPDSAITGSEDTPADATGELPLAANSLADDMPSSLLITSGGDAVISPNPRAPRSARLPPNPGALSFSFPPSDSEGGGDDRGDDSPSAGSEGASSNGQPSAGQPAIIVQRTASFTERLATAAAEKALALAQTTAETAVSDLRHEIYVSRAAWNALFPR